MDEYICSLNFEKPGSYKLHLEFNSMLQARGAAVEIFSFLGVSLPICVSSDSAREKDPVHSVSNPAPEEPEESRSEQEISFRDMLLTYREKHGYSQRDLAKLLGINQSTVSAWERELWKPSEETVQAIRNRLNGGITHE